MTATATAPRRARNPRSGIRRGEALAGWVFTLPVILILGVFLLVPVVMALWVSVSDWTGRGSPFSPRVGFVGLENYAAVTVRDGLATRDFGTAMRNNVWYVLLVVPLQTALSLFLAVLVNGAMLRGRGILPHRVLLPVGDGGGGDHGALHLPLQPARCGQRVLGAIGIDGPNWLADPEGHPAHPPRGRRHRRRPGGTHRRTTSSVCRGGTGSPDRRSR